MPPHDSSVRKRPELSDEELVAQAVLRLNGHILGLVLGVLAALVVFAATNWLVIKGGQPLGPHLALLAQYFIGYRVSFLGSFVGMAYAFVLGYVAGYVIGRVYNRMVDFRYPSPRR